MFFLQFKYKFLERKISNQLFLYCQLFLLLSNNFACSMQSQQLALRRNEQEEAEKIIKGFPEVAMFIYLMATKNPITRLSGLQCENLFYTKHQESWNLLLEGPPRNGKRTLAKNIAKYLDMECTLIRIKDIIPRYPHTHQVDLLESQILPYLSQENSQHVFIIDLF